MHEPFFTIGHSTRTLGELLGLLREAGVDILVDVRAFPGSRRYPHFNKDSLSLSVPAEGLRYEHMPALGGRRRKSLGETESPNPYWRNVSFRRYADYALSDEFRAGLQALQSLAREGHCALMCSEAVWWRCHRRIISDYLLVEGHQVEHILGPRSIEPAKLTPGARPLAGPRIHYEEDRPQASLF